MKKRPSKKLVLRRESIRALTIGERTVVGLSPMPSMWESVCEDDGGGSDSCVMCSNDC